MLHAFFLARQYIGCHKLKTLILVACIGLTAYLPAALHLLIDRFQSELLSRAKATPLVVGSKGSRFDLALHALYFDAEVPGTVAMRDAEQIAESGFATPIPLLIRFRARGFPIVGTSLDYFDFRNLQVDVGGPFSRLGDCVLGANVARQLNLRPGDFLLSDPDNVFDIAGSYPLKMRVAGILRTAYSPDDNAVFVDVKTAWIIHGFGHGHQDLADEEDRELVLDRSEEKVVASAAVVQYTQITDDNIESFHFHGDTADFPLTAVIADPRDTKSATLLSGRYLDDDARAQILVPADVVDELMEMVFRVKRFFDIGSLLVGLVTTMFVTLVILLSLRLRAGEMETMFRLGCSRFTIFRLQAAELTLVVAVSLLVAGALALTTARFAPQMLRQWLF